MLSVVYYVDVCLGHVISQIDAVLVYSQQLPVVRQSTITLVFNITSDTRDLIIINNVACYYIKQVLRSSSAPVIYSPAGTAHHNKLTFCLSTPKICSSLIAPGKLSSTGVLYLFVSGLRIIFYPSYFNDKILTGALHTLANIKI